jgi:hypothetical protein
MGLIGAGLKGIILGKSRSNINLMEGRIMRKYAAFLMTALLLFCGIQASAEKATPFLGAWALTAEDGGIGWLKVRQEKGYLDADLLWRGGSVGTVGNIYVDGKSLVVTRQHKRDKKDAAGKVVRSLYLSESFTMSLSKGKLQGLRQSPNENGLGVTSEKFIGTPEPAAPAAPDLSKVRYDDPIDLLADFNDWQFRGDGRVNGWRIEDGILKNGKPQKEGAPRVRYGNLLTKATFEDFNITLDVNIPPHGNSGVYLRGIYEVQVEDSYEKPIGAHGLGAIYSRIATSEKAEKPANEWQHMDITLMNRHVTVKINGVTVIDNQFLEGCTGGALNSDVTQAGPIYLQGDHGPIQYKNVQLRPVIK